MFSDESNSPVNATSQRTPPKSNNSNNNNTSNNVKEDWGWEDSGWDPKPSENSYQSSNKSSKPTKSKKDLMNFDEDNWEAIEPSNSKKD